MNTDKYERIIDKEAADYIAAGGDVTSDGLAAFFWRCFLKLKNLNLKERKIEETQPKIVLPS